MPWTADINPLRPVLLPSVFPSGRNVLDLKPILGLQLPDRVGHCGLILFGVGKGQVQAIDPGRTLALQKQAVEPVQQLAIRTHQLHPRHTGQRHAWFGLTRLRPTGRSFRKSGPRAFGHRRKSLVAVLDPHRHEFSAFQFVEQLVGGADQADPRSNALDRERIGHWQVLVRFQHGAVHVQREFLTVLRPGG